MWNNVSKSWKFMILCAINVWNKSSYISTPPAPHGGGWGEWVERARENELKEGEGKVSVRIRSKADIAKLELHVSFSFFLHPHPSRFNIIRRKNLGQFSFSLH